MSAAEHIYREFGALRLLRASRYSEAELRTENRRAIEAINIKGS